MRALVIAALCTVAATAGTAAADRPTQVTKRFMRELLTGQRPWREVIDPASGVFDLGYRTGDFDGDVRWGRHACDARAPLRRLARQLGRQPNLDELELTCRNRGGAHACTVDAVGEFMPAWRFELPPAGKGLCESPFQTTHTVANAAVGMSSGVLSSLPIICAFCGTVATTFIA
ncbi:MAG: hypothetical protein JNK64_21840 [Myxococcales bacterium]|nr:hypothetical protein [Myxococcales bacterium]